MVKTATNRNGDRQNGDRLPWPKRRQTKTATNQNGDGNCFHGSYTRWTCVLGRRPQYTTRLRGRCECSQPCGFNNRLTAPTHRSAGCLMSLLQDKTWLPLPRMSRLSALGCQTTVYCSGLTLLLAPRRLSKRHSLDINDFRSAILYALSTEW